MQGYYFKIRENNAAIESLVVSVLEEAGISFSKYMTGTYHAESMCCQLVASLVDSGYITNVERIPKVQAF